MDIRYTEDHEWIAIEAEIATVGITDHAQELLGDLVFVELPAVGKEVQKGAAVAVVESVKSASDVYSPLTGAIVEVNKRVVDEPAIVNSDPAGNGWLFKIRMHDSTELDQLLSESDYKRSLK
jgi:glycine cleavage system H protein